MSVGEEQTECPLCMELLEMDDLNFFPCTCGYQICRFCWHRIRTDENGLCPACRKQYPEDPAVFKPLTEDELQRIKKERRQKDLQRKQKAAENRKHLANVRVVQRNLVFVVGLSQRLADPEVLKKNEYFGKFGKIHKVVINHSTSYAGAQVSQSGPSASAYVTYNRPEDALRAIQAVNNIFVDGRTLKASLGTTKYCSHFLRGAQCPKPDCMYLHELGEEAASFTKEEMQQGKHQEYEQKLYEQFMNSQNLANQQLSSSPPVATTPPAQSSSPPANKSNQHRKKTGSPQPHTIVGDNSGTKEAWPSLNPTSNRPERLTNGNKASTSSAVTPPDPSSSPTQQQQQQQQPSHSNKTESQHNSHNKAPGHHRTKSTSENEQQNNKSKGQSQQQGTTQNNRGQAHIQQTTHNNTHNNTQHNTQQSQPPAQHTQQQIQHLAQQFQNSVNTGQHSPLGGTTRASPFDTGANSMSLFSNNGFSRNPKPFVQLHTEGIPTTEIPDTIPVSSTTDWQAAFGFSSAPSQQQQPQQPQQQPPQPPQTTAHVMPPPQPPAPSSSELHDDDLDLGFDPWDESSKALQDLIAKESMYQHTAGMVLPPPGHPSHQQMAALQQQHAENTRPKNLPPGFSPNHIGAYNGSVPNMGFSGSKMMGLMQMGGAPVVPPGVHSQNTYHDVLSDISLTSTASKDGQHTHTQQPQTNVFTTKDWQDGLRALLPNINISFGPTHAAESAANTAPRNIPVHNNHSHSANQQNWSTQDSSSSPSTSLAWDPAIVTSGNITANNGVSEEPHWMASLQHLTEENTNHRLPFLQQFPFRAPNWAPQAAHPPPGFQTMQSPTQLPTEPHKLTADGIQ